MVTEFTSTSHREIKEYMWRGYEGSFKKAYTFKWINTEGFFPQGIASQQNLMIAHYILIVIMLVDLSQSSIFLCYPRCWLSSSTGCCHLRLLTSMKLGRVKNARGYGWWKALLAKEIGRLQQLQSICLVFKGCGKILVPPPIRLTNNLLPSLPTAILYFPQFCLHQGTRTAVHWTQRLTYTISWKNRGLWTVLYNIGLPIEHGVSYRQEYPQD